MSTDAVFQRERVQVIWEELQPLFRLHWEEIAAYRDIPLDPHEQAYFTFEDSGVLRWYTARVAGRIVGYAVFLVGAALHYRGSLQARNDLVYLHPEHRGRRLGVALLEYADAALAAEGVQLISYHVKPAHPALAQLLEQRGFIHHETVYSRRTDHD